MSCCVAPNTNTNHYLCEDDTLVEAAEGCTEGDIRVFY